jgi:hypothetical protein
MTSAGYSLQNSHFLTMTTKKTRITKQEIEATTSESLQLPLPFEPVPDDAVPRILSKLFKLAIEGNTSAAKLFIDILKDKSEDAPAALTAEDALKLLQEHFRQ